MGLGRGGQLEEQNHTPDGKVMTDRKPIGEVKAQHLL